MNTQSAERPAHRRGVLLANLGSPESPSVRDVRRYLREFLMDPRVLDTPYLLRWLIVNLSILPRRPKQTAAAYRLIWRPEGSPLLVTSRRVQHLLAEKVDLPLALGMRYGNPSIESALGELLAQSDPPIQEVLLIPLYPHYAASSYETVEVLTRDLLRRMAPRVALRVIPPFYDRPAYIEALAASAAEHLRWDYDHLLFSYHGLPERHMRKADPTGAHCMAASDCCNVDSPAHATCYRAQVFRTTEAFVRAADVPEGKYSISFQSRLGREPWLRPYTDFELPRLASQGVKRLLVLCPAFVADCLETLEEIGIRAKADFERAGGEELRLIPCLNEHPAWIDALCEMCWMETKEASGPVSD